MSLTVEELLEKLKAIVDGAEGRDLTDEEAEEYESLETDLRSARRTVEIRSRQTAYETPVGANAYVATATRDDNEDLNRAFDHYLRTGIANQDIVELRAQGTSPDSAGGFMVSPQFRQKLVEVRKDFGGLAAEVESFSTETGATLEYPSLDDTANVGQITAEGAAVAGGADLTFGTVGLGAFKYTASGAGNAPVKVNVELLQDAEFDVQGLLARRLGERIARKQATDWVVGAGTTLPFGVIHAGLTADVTITGATITYDQLVDVETALDGAYEPNAKWLMSRATWAILRKVKDTAGRPLLMEQAVAGAGGRIERSMLGYPVVLDNACPANAINTKFAALGDYREGYVIRRVSNIVVMVNPYSSAASGQVEFHAWERADGNIQNRKAYAILARGGT